MSDIAAFKQNFETWARQLEEEGDTGIEEIREQIRTDWANEELRNLWINFVKEKVNGSAPAATP